MFNFGVNLIKNSNLGIINSCAIFKFKLNLTIGFKNFGFICFGTCTCVILQLLAPQLHTAVCYFETCCFCRLLHPPSFNLWQKCHNLLICFSGYRSYSLRLHSWEKNKLGSAHSYLCRKMLILYLQWSSSPYLHHL